MVTTTVTVNDAAGQAISGPLASPMNVASSNATLYPLNVTNISAAPFSSGPIAHSGGCGPIQVSASASGATTANQPYGNYPQILNGNDSGAGSLRSIMAATPPAGTIAYSATNQTITLASSLPPVTNNFGICALAGNTLTINGASLYQVLTASAGSAALSLANVTIINGTNPMFTSEAGGIAMGTGQLTLKNVTMSANHGNSSITSSGCALSLAGPAVITNSTFSANTCPAPGSQGGAIYTNSSLTITNSSFSGSSSGTGGSAGAIYVGGGTFSCTGCTFANNGAYSQGGAIFLNGGISDSITNSTFTGNTARIGGAIAIST